MFYGTFEYPLKVVIQNTLQLYFFAPDKEDASQVAIVDESEKE